MDQKPLAKQNNLRIQLRQFYNIEEINYYLKIKLIERTVAT